MLFSQSTAHHQVDRWRMLPVSNLYRKWQKLPSYRQHVDARVLGVVLSVSNERRKRSRHILIPMLWDDVLSTLMDGNFVMSATDSSKYFITGHLALLPFLQWTGLQEPGSCGSYCRQQTDWSWRCVCYIIYGIGVGDGSVVESAPRDMKVSRGCGFETHWVLLLGPRATGALWPA